MPFSLRLVPSPVSIKHGLQTMDWGIKCGLQSTVCSLQSMFYTDWTQSLKILPSAQHNSIHSTPYLTSDWLKAGWSWSVNQYPAVWYDVALRESDKPFQAQTFTCIRMRQVAAFYSTQSGNSELSCSWDRSVSKPVPQDLLSLWFLVIHKLGGLPYHVHRKFWIKNP